MPGFFENLGQGLQYAGGILSPEVYQNQRDERSLLLQQLIRQRQLQQALAARAIESGALDPSVGPGLGLPPGLGPSATSLDRLYKLSRPKQVSEFAKPNPKDYTPESLKDYQQTGDVSVLKPRKSETHSSIAKELMDAGYTPGSAEYTRLMQKRIARETSPTQTMINVSTANVPSPMAGKTAEDLKAMSWVELTKKTKMPLSQQAYKDASFQYAITGNMPKTAWGAQGQPMRNAYEEGRAKIAADLGLSPEEIALKPAHWKADALSLNKITTRRDTVSAILGSFHNNIKTFESVAEGKPPQLSGERIAALGADFQRIDFSNVKALNEAKLAINRQFNDPATVAYVTAAVTVAMDYARILSSQGQSAAQVTDTARAEALNLIAVGYNKKAREALIGTLESDTAGQLKGLEDQIKRISGRMGISNNALSADPSVPALSPANTGWTVRKK